MRSAVREKGYNNAVPYLIRRKPHGIARPPTAPLVRPPVRRPLLCIAVFPLAFEHWWEKNRHKALVAAVLSLPVVALFWHFGDLHPLLTEVEEYFSFIVLLGSLFVISGGIYIHGAARRGLTLNASFEGLICNLLLVLRKELHMPKVVGIRFHGTGKAYHFDPGEHLLHQGDAVIVETVQGIELGVCLG